MKVLLNVFLILTLLIGVYSCSTEGENVLDENVAINYVGEWSNRYQLAKDANRVTIERINNSEIVMNNFFNLGKSTTFSVEAHNLTITTTVVDGLSVSGEGTSNYSFDEITIYYTLDGDDFKSDLIKLN